MILRGTVYHAHNPRWAFAPMSGDGAARHGGRFNPIGMPALYTSWRMETAWLEAQQGFPFKAQPLTIRAYSVDCQDVVDLTDEATCAALSIDKTLLGCPCEDMVWRRQTPPTWHLAHAVIARGIAAIIVPSFAPGRTSTDRHVVFYRWSAVPPHKVAVIDDEARLPKDDLSWL